MTRIIGGRARGRRLLTPAGRDTRPTSDRVREALFSSVESRGVLAGARVLDLYAGSGALGLEAASRGAKAVLLVESDRGAASVVRRNAASLGLAGVRVRTGAVERVVRTAPDQGYDVILVDPPYGLAEAALEAVLAALADSGWLAPGALLVVERSARSPEPVWPQGVEPEGGRTYGETALWYASAGSGAPARS